MNEAQFRGVFTHVVSPVEQAGEVNADVLARLCDNLIEAGVHGLTLSAGEFAYPPWPQRRRVVEVVIAAAKCRVPVERQQYFSAAQSCDYAPSQAAAKRYATVLTLARNRSAVR